MFCLSCTKALVAVAVMIFEMEIFSIIIIQSSSEFKGNKKGSVLVVCYFTRFNNKISRLLDCEKRFCEFFDKLLLQSIFESITLVTYD
jgi:hypothetical protein